LRKAKPAARRGRKATGLDRITGLLAGLINTVFLLTVFSDIGTNVANPCEAAIDRAKMAIEEDPA
jgi:hypothetical protein